MSTKKWNTMLCDRCLLDREVSDFLKNQKFCYKCIYEIKTEGKIKKTKKNYCRVCSKEVILEKNARKRQRSVFCSCECALKGHKSLSNNHWTRKLRRSSTVTIV